MEKVEKSLLILLLVIFTSCYKQLEMEGFNKDKWINGQNDCDTYRLDISETIIENQDILLESTQNEIESLLGKPQEHELYDRNQKFFHYRLTPQERCGEYKTVKYLSIRFNAIGRANLIQVMLREP